MVFLEYELCLNLFISDHSKAFAIPAGSSMLFQ